MTEQAPAQKMSEWLKVMLAEIDRRRRESDEARAERRQRSGKPGDSQAK